MFRPTQPKPNEVNQHHLINKSARIINAAKAEEHVEWPNERTLEEIERLYQLPLAAELAKLPQHANILDIGPGKGVALHDIYQRFSLSCHGIGPNKLDPKNEAKIKEMSYGTVPDNQTWLVRRRGFFQVSFDTYAALTYSDNVLHSLIYIMLAMAPGGVLFCMSSLTPGDIEHSKFGGSLIRYKIKSFMKDNFNIDIRFDYVKIQSKACKPGELMDDLRVMMSIPKSGLSIPAELAGKSTRALFKSICEMADKNIGTPIERKNSIWFKAGKFKIVTCDFVTEEERRPKLGWY